MRLLVTTPSDKIVHMENRHVQIPAGSVDYVITTTPERLLEDIRALINDVTTLKLDYNLATDVKEIKVDVVDAGNATGGANTRTGVGFNLVGPLGVKVVGQYVLKFGAFDNADLTTAAANATMATAASGTILSGSGTNSLVVKTDANGEFRCTLSDATDETVFTAAGVPEFGHSAFDCSDSDATTFSA
jgi:hypothetical protein